MNDDIERVTEEEEERNDAEADADLNEYDKTVADSFPASDPPAQP